MKLTEVPIHIEIQECMDVRCPPDMRVRVLVNKLGEESEYFFASKAEAVAFTTNDLIGTPEQFLDKVQEIVKPGESSERK